MNKQWRMLSRLQRLELCQLAGVEVNVDEDDFKEFSPEDRMRITNKAVEGKAQDYPVESWVQIDLF